MLILVVDSFNVPQSRWRCFLDVFLFWDYFLLVVGAFWQSSYFGAVFDRQQW